MYKSSDQSIKEYTAKISALMDNNNGRLVDIAFLAYEVIDSAKEMSPYVLKEFLNSMPYSQNQYSKTNSLIPDSYLNSKLRSVMLTVDAWLDKVLSNKLDEDEFYTMLWDFLKNDNKAFRGKKTKTVALYCVWMDPRIPYYKLEPGIKMDEAQFSDTYNRIRPDLQKARFAVFSPYDKRIEEASVIYNIMEKLGNTEEKCILLSYVIKSVELRTIKEFLRESTKKLKDES